MASATREVKHGINRDARESSFRRSLDVVFGQHVLLSLVALRIFNALTIRTFFQPDEYYQSLEPAWQIAFGGGSGAWITWEWRNHLRSALHPVLFAVVYYTASCISYLCDFSPALRADFLIAAPKVLQAVFAALTDYYTWQLATRVYGQGTGAAGWTLALTIFSPWQWFCCTRTLSNCLETTLTVTALHLWPWQWSLPSSSMDVVDDDGLRTSVSADEYTLDELAKSAVLALSVLVDRLYYQTWTFPPVRFLYFNIAQSLAAFYGKNRWDYYFTEGLPLLLTTALPFAVAGLWQALQPLPQHPPPNLPGSEARKALLSKSALRALALTTVFVAVLLSSISHKEVRFIYPLLPILHLLSAHPLAAFFRPVTKLHWKAPLLVAVLLFNIGLGQYASLVHQRGVIDVLSFLRHEQEAATEIATANGGAHGQGNITVAFLMPCHSTPWRSHLVHSSIDAWVLTCEPPLGVPLDQRHAYRDEADQFYDDPEGWLSANMQGPATTIAATKGHGAGDGRRPWPRCLVFFEQLEPMLRERMSGSGYRECWRGFNSRWHDDWRRKGDVVVWCMETE